MLFKNIAILDENLEARENQFVGIKGDKIAYVGPQAPKEDYDTSYDGRGKLLMTGLINSHTHTPMTLMRGYAENKSLQDWLFNHIFPFEDKITPDDVYYAALLGIAEMLRYGTVSSTEMYFHTERIIEAALNSGFKMNICSGIVSFDGKPLAENKNFQEEVFYTQQYHLAGSGRIRTDLSLHAEYTSNPSIVEDLAAYCAQREFGVHVHISETKKEVEECKERHNGLTPPQYFEKLGLFKSRVNGAHCVWLEGEDFDIMAENHVTAAHCPVSNMKLASGVAPIPKLLDLGINVALGTDGVASNNNLNLFEEMKFGALMQKGIYHDPTLITPEQMLRAATCNGAQAQGRTDCGALKAGNKADLVVIDLQKPQMQPIHRIANQLLYAADGSEVILTMVDGNVLYQDGTYPTIDLEKAIYETEKAKVRILGQL